MKKQTVTSIVHHHIKKDKIDDFHLWLKSVKEESLKFDGYIDSKLIESLGSENEVISIFRFENKKFLESWLNSEVHKKLLTQLRLIVNKETRIKSYSGLEFWFDRTPEARMKNSILTFIGLLPLVLYIPPLIAKYTAMDGFWLNTISTALIVLLMTYIVMPFVMKIKTLIFNRF
jgi:antibiotic biosynthesis monooxygenase (ABM) superfamily enzyme